MCIGTSVQISVEDDICFKFEDVVMKSGYMFVRDPKMEMYTITVDEVRPEVVNKKQWEIESLKDQTMFILFY